MGEVTIGNRSLTPYKELDDVLIDYAHTSSAVLGNNFVGLYPVGSLAIGDFDLTSDVDFLIITNREIDSDEVKQIQTAHSTLLGRKSRWVKHLEYSIFSLDQ